MSLSEGWLDIENVIHGPKPCKFIRFGSIHGPKPYEFIKFGAMDATKPPPAWLLQVVLRKAVPDEPSFDGCLEDWPPRNLSEAFGL